MTSEKKCNPPKNCPFSRSGCPFLEEMAIMRNDLKWIKRILFAYILPLILAILAALLK